jgi:hypothetical protein
VILPLLVFPDLVQFHPLGLISFTNFKLQFKILILSFFQIANGKNLTQCKLNLSNLLSSLRGQSGRFVSERAELATSPSRFSYES